MAKSKGPSFNFGANARPRKSSGKAKKKSGKSTRGGNGKSQAWRAYTGDRDFIPN